MILLQVFEKKFRWAEFVTGVFLKLNDGELIKNVKCFGC